MTSLTHQLNARMRADFRFAVMSVFALCGVLGILPFAVYRFAIGDVVAGVMDSLIAILIAAPVAWAWRSGSIAGPALTQVAVISIASVVAAEVLGRNGMLWAYCALLANFFLVDRRIALGANLFVVVGIAVLGGGFPENSERVSFAVTAAIVSLYAYIFASRTELQRLQLEALASHDPLTGAGNRRLLERELEDAVLQFQQRPRPVALAVIDLDHFKRINDQHGHEAGDRVLARFAEITRGHLRKLDRLYRLGGEEFVLLLPATPPAGLGVVLDKLQEALRQELRCVDTPVTVSIGAAALHAGESWSDWLARADAALYRAKHAGRDRHIIDHDPAAHTGSVEVQAERRQRR
ncbi:MAG: GGDEF domain-containing protein [Aquimonas sp.]|nr:GGDEF domain-containing protein [Aquimonas sp.]